MKNKLTLFVAIQAILIVLLIWLLTYLGRDEFNNANDPIDTKKTNSYIKKENGLDFVVISKAVQLNSGIKTAKIKVATHAKTISSYGNVLNLDALIEQKNKLNEIKNQINILKNEFNRDKRNYERFKSLNEDNKNISDKTLQESQVAYQTTQFNLIKSQALIDGLEQNIRVQWGDKILAMIQSPASNNILDFLLHDKARLIRITLSNNFTNDIPKDISLSLIDNPHDQFLAKYLSEAPQLDKNLQGKTYFYVTYNNQLRFDSRLIVSASQPNSSNNSNKLLFIPKESIVWNAGKAWIYIKTAEDKFVRKSIDTSVEDNDGWMINEDQIKENDEIVVSGSQLMLSEEFKYQIKNENDD